VQDIAPGGNKAIIALSNGKKINVTDAKAGVIAQEKNLTITKAKDGTISYTANNSTGAGKEVAYNSITAPRGGQSPVILPGGTKTIFTEVIIP
jgi:transmembrane sensor